MIVLRLLFGWWLVATGAVLGLYGLVCFWRWFASEEPTPYDGAEDTADELRACHAEADALLDSIRAHVRTRTPEQLADETGYTDLHRGDFRP